MLHRSDVDHAPALNAPGVTYSKIPGLEQFTHFDCAKLHARLATSVCADMWRAANEGHSERYSACRACPIGAAHAGVDNASRSPIRGALICARCQEGTNRLIKGHLCPSCYNREREVRVGRNARGDYPVRAKPMHARQVCYVESGRVMVRRMERTTTAGELLLATLRDAVHSVVFGWRAPRFGLRQMRLF